MNSFCGIKSLAIQYPACRYDLNGNLILFFSKVEESEEITTFPSRTICFALVSLLCNDEHKRTGRSSGDADAGASSASGGLRTLYGRSGDGFIKSSILGPDYVVIWCNKLKFPIFGAPQKHVSPARELKLMKYSKYLRLNLNVSNFTLGSPKCINSLGL